jgi:hypothetical protein
MTDDLELVSMLNEMVQLHTRAEYDAMCSVLAKELSADEMLMLRYGCKVAMWKSAIN